MARGGIALAQNVSSVGAQPAFSWVGGRTAIVVCATTYPSTCNVEMQLQNGAWLQVNNASLAADGYELHDLPPGQYRVNTAGGPVAGLYVSLVAIAYT